MSMARKIENVSHRHLELKVETFIYLFTYTVACMSRKSIRRTSTEQIRVPEIRSVVKLPITYEVKKVERNGNLVIITIEILKEGE